MSKILIPSWSSSHFWNFSYCLGYSLVSSKRTVLGPTNWDCCLQRQDYCTEWACSGLSFSCLTTPNSWRPLACCSCSQSMSKLSSFADSWGSCCLDLSVFTGSPYLKNALFHCLSFSPDSVLIYKTPLADFSPSTEAFGCWSSTVNFDCTPHWDAELLASLHSLCYFGPFSLCHVRHCEHPWFPEYLALHIQCC